jgi:hypothetical protein
VVAVVVHLLGRRNPEEQEPDDATDEDRRDGAGSAAGDSGVRRQADEQLG